MTHTRFVVVADDRRARIYRVTTDWGVEGKPRPVLVARGHCQRVRDEPCGPYANAIVDAMLRAVVGASAPSVVVTTTPRIHQCLRDRLMRVVRAGVPVCELGLDLTDLSDPELEEELSAGAFV